MSLNAAIAPHTKNITWLVIRNKPQARRQRWSRNTIDSHGPPVLPLEDATSSFLLGGTDMVW